MTFFGVWDQNHLVLFCSLNRLTWLFACLLQKGFCRNSFINVKFPCCDNSVIFCYFKHLFSSFPFSDLISCFLHLEYFSCQYLELIVIKYVTQSFGCSFYWELNIARIPLNSANIHLATSEGLYFFSLHQDEVGSTENLSVGE